MVSASAATLASTIALAIVARLEGKGVAQPLNATSHWLYGADAARYRNTDVDHTIVGFATHAAATFFWAAAFETTLAIRPAKTPLSLLRQAASVGALAALVDYTITPKRFTPGWELVLTKRSMAVVYAAMAAGFALGASRKTD